MRQLIYLLFFYAQNDLRQLLALYQIMDYKGGRTLEELIKFVENHGVVEEEDGDDDDDDDDEDDEEEEPPRDEL